MSSTRKIFLFIALPLIVIFAGALVWQAKFAPATTETTSQPTRQEPSQNTQATPTGDQPANVKNLGFNLDYYNETTKRAGDLHFAESLAQAVKNEPTYQKMIWTDFGLQDVRSPNDPSKKNVQLIFRLPLGTKILSPIDGVVTKIETLYSNDYTIWLASSQDSSWQYETEHVIKPSVKAGDTVKAGQVIAEVSTHDSQHHPGFGVYEFGLFKPQNNQPAHWCPVEHLDPTVKDELSKKITAFYAAWEKFMNDTTIYDEASYKLPGCVTLEPALG